MSIEHPSQAPAKLEPEENIVSEREEDIRLILEAHPYSLEKKATPPWFDAQVFNLGIIHLYRAMIEGRYFDRVDAVAYEAFAAMQEHWGTNPKKIEGVDNSCIGTSPMGQMFCAILHAFSRGSLQDHELLKKAKTITTEEDTKEAQGMFFRHFEDLCNTSDRPFHHACFDIGIEMVKDMREHNLKHPEALEYFVPVNYGPWPKRAELVEEFGEEAKVSPYFNDVTTFTLNASCKDMPTTSGVEIMCLRQFNHHMSPPSIITELQNETNSRSPKGYRPGIAGELLCFSRAMEHAFNSQWTGAFGSEMSVHGKRTVACLWGSDRRLGLYWVGYGWDGGYRFLAVRK